MKKILLLISLCSIPAFAAGPFSIGVIGGAPFTDVVNSVNQNNFNFTSKSTNYTVGPTIQVNLPFNFRFEFDALYRPYNFTATSSVPAPLATGLAPAIVTAHQWSYPMLAQYRFKLPVVSPFLEAGGAVDHISGISDVGSSILSGTAITTFTPNAGALQHKSTGEFIIGGGADLKIPFVRISGELRYERVGASFFRNVSNLNQAEFLVGVRF